MGIMGWTFLDIFGAWIALFTISLAVFPVLQILEWRKRGTAAGYSSFPQMLPVLMMACFLRHSLMSDDGHGPFVVSVHLVLGSACIIAFGYYSPVRRYLALQLFCLFSTLGVIFSYVDSFDDQKEAAAAMGKICVAVQQLGMIGGIYEMGRAIQLKTTEYIPARVTFFFSVFTSQWFVYSLLTGKYMMALGQAPGLVMQALTFILYVIYPPVTWRVPILGVQAKDRKLE